MEESFGEIGGHLRTEGGERKEEIRNDLLLLLFVVRVRRAGGSSALRGSRGGAESGGEDR